MAYGPEYHNGYTSYSAVMRHVETGREFMIQVGASTGLPNPPPDLVALEAQNDALFEAILSDIVALGSLEILSATKYGNFASDVTVPASP